MTKSIWHISLLPFVLCSAALLGCNANLHKTSDPKVTASSVAVAHDEEQHGMMSSADYLRWETVGNKVSAQRSIDDDDLNWAISTMQKPSTEPSELHQDIMSLFETAKTFGPGQKEKIRAAVTPLLTSHDHEEAKCAKNVLKRL